MRSSFALKTYFLEPTSENLLKCASFLKEGEVVALPTETVYGLAADAFCVSAVAKVFKAKRRPLIKPLICNISSLDMFYRLSFIGSKLLRVVFEKFWPGPLTVVVPKKSYVSNLVTAGGYTVAIRFSSNPILKKITDIVGSPLVIPSANISGHGSCVDAFSVYNELKFKVQAVVNGGVSEIGKESTIIFLQGHNVKILRLGAITKECLKKGLKDAIFVD